MENTRILEVVVPSVPQPRGWNVASGVGNFRDVNEVSRPASKASLEPEKKNLPEQKICAKDGNEHRRRRTENCPSNQDQSPVEYRTPNNELLTSTVQLLGVSVQRQGDSGPAVAAPWNDNASVITLLITTVRPSRKTGELCVCQGIMARWACERKHRDTGNSFVPLMHRAVESVGRD